LFAISGVLAALEHDERSGLAFSAGSCPAYRLLHSDDEGAACWPPGLQLAALEAAPGGEASTDQPAPAEAREPRWILAGLAAFAEVAVTAGKATITFEHTSFNVKNEGWFGTDTEFGGADKASHFVDYYVITKEFAFIFRQLGFSENASRWMAAGTAFAGGLTNEVADGFTKYGFSYGDLVMNSLGIATALVVTGAHVDDVVGFRTSHFGSYKHDVYSMDLNLAGLARRLKLNIGPLRFLYFSATYGVKGYPTDDVEERQRQIGLEIGLNLEEILNTFGVRRDTWWGTSLHLVADNIRFPFTAVGFRYDLNHHKWRGPNTGNFP
jgi:hypothetical protein